MDIETENVINLIFPEGIPGKINFVTLRLIVNALLLNNMYFMQFQNVGKKILIFINIFLNLEAST